MSRLASIAFICLIPLLGAQESSPLPPAAVPPLPVPGNDQPPPIPLPDPSPAPAAAQEEAIPKAFPPERYQASWQKNPFLLKTAPVIQQKESWAMDWALASIAQIGGKFRVSIKNKKTGEYERVTSGGESRNGFGIVAVNLKPSRKESSVELTKAGETATLTYDESVNAPAMRPGMAPGQTMGRTMMPGQPPPLPGAPSVPPGVAPARTASTGGRAYTPPNQSMAMNQPPGGNYAGYQRPAMVGGGGGFVGNPNLPPGSAANPVSFAAPGAAAASAAPAASTTAALNAGTAINVAVPTVNTTTTATGTTVTTTTPALPATTNGPRRRQLIPAPTVNSNP